MVIRRSLYLLCVLTALPVQLLAQGPDNGSVTTRPLGQHAPALSWPLLMILSVALAAIALYRLRQSGVNLGTVGVLAASIVFASLSYAAISPTPVVISGADCTQQVVTSYDPSHENILENDCANQIEVVAQNATCNDHETIPDADTSCVTTQACSVGSILAPGAQCVLPDCIC